MARSSLSFVLLSSALLSACNSSGGDIDRQLLTPPQAWLAEPADVGIDAESVDIALNGDASLTGFLIPRASALGTVVLIHDSDVNDSALNPYYTFLHADCFQV